MSINLSRAVLKKANMQDANLEGANLEGANLEGANLEGANLSLAKFRWAKFKKIKLYHANLIGAFWINGEQIVGGSYPMWKLNNNKYLKIYDQFPSNQEDSYSIVSN